MSPIELALEEIGGRWTATELLVPNGAMLAMGITGERMNALVGAKFSIDEKSLAVGDTTIPCSYGLGERGIAASIFYWDQEKRAHRDPIAERLLEIDDGDEYERILIGARGKPPTDEHSFYYFRRTKRLLYRGESNYLLLEALE